MKISIQYLRDNPDHIFVFGDNTLRKGKKGGAMLRDEPNAYGFITKKYPSYKNDAYYKPKEYQYVYMTESAKLMSHIISSPNKTFLISKIGSGLANKYKIFDKIIEPKIKEGFKNFKNVKFLW